MKDNVSSRTLDEKILALFDRALAERETLTTWIKELSSNPTPTVRDRLCLALYRHQLSFREPRLPSGISFDGSSLWQYWRDHPDEYQEHRALENELLSYLKPNDELEADNVRREGAMLDLISTDKVTYMALYPMVKESFDTKPGRPATRRGPDAVRALQMKLEQRLTWTKIANLFCDCDKPKHEHSCSEAIRLSTIALRKLLRRCGVELPA